MPQYFSDIKGAGRRFGGLATSATGAVKSYMGTSVHRAGMKGITQDLLGIGGGTLGKVIGLGSLAYYTGKGFMEEGAWGAVKGAAGAGAEFYAFGAGMKLAGIGLKTAGLFGAAGLGVGIASGIAMAGYGGINPMQLAARPAVNEYMRKRAKLEMGSPVQDPYGTVSTMRKRSLMAMRQSKITARGALGMESNRRYTPYMR